MKISLEESFRELSRAALFRLLGWLKSHGKAKRTVSEMFRFWYDLPIDPIHYYSPLPDVAKVKKTLKMRR